MIKCGFGRIFELSEHIVPISLSANIYNGIGDLYFGFEVDLQIPGNVERSGIIERNLIPSKCCVYFN